MQTLSVCMIVKNEQKFIRDCLESIKPVADEIIIVDTGSTDKTIEIVREYTEKIFPFQWVDDFSAARNESIRHAQNDWILWLDADERLRPESIPILKKLLTKEKKPTAYVLPIWNMLADKKNYKLSGAHRLFTNHKGLYFTGRIHEQIVQSLAAKKGNERNCAVTLIHLGYGLEKDAQNKKNERNRKLLKRMVKEEPQNAYAHFTLAQNYSQALEWEKAAKHYREALKYHRFDPGMEASLLNTYGEALMKLGQTKQAQKMALQSISKIPQQGGGYYLLYKLAENEGDRQKTLNWLLKLFDSNQKLRESGKKLSTDILLNQDDVTFEIFKTYLALNDAQKALDWLSKLPQEKQIDGGLLLKKAELYFKTNNLNGAQNILKNDMFAQNPGALNLLGITYIKQQDWNKAVYTYEELLKIEPDNSDTIKRLAGIYAKNGQMEKAQALVKLLNSKF